MTATAFLGSTPAAGRWRGRWRRWAAVAAGVVASAAAVDASAEDAARRTRENLAATCSQCHGVEGRALPGAAVPGLAGRPAAEFVAQMKAFQDGSRPATVMHQLARGYSDAQIEQLAAYYAAQSRTAP